jgi:fatty acid desaturase
MLSVFRHTPVLFLIFPIGVWATWQGGYLPSAVAAGIVVAYILSDNFTPSLTSIPTRKHTALNNALLLLQIPATVGLLLVLMCKLGPEAEPARWISKLVGRPLAGLDSTGQIVAACTACGFFLSANTAVAHECMHRRSVFWKSCSRILLVLTGDAQFQEAHLYGHHANVATHRDPATARRFESLYRFIIRSTVGQWLEAYRFERKRLRARGGLGKALENRVLRGNLASAALLALAGLSFGVDAALGYLLVMVTTKFLLEAINYMQHYGLVRERGTKVQPIHSWDSNGRGATMALFNLTRHADHHANPTLPFWDLKNHQEAPQLIHGYLATFFITLIPPLWYRYMEPRLASVQARAEVPAPEQGAQA